MEIRLDASTIGKLKVNPKSLFQNFLNFDWGSALTETVGHEKTKEMLAFQLLFKSMQATNIELSQKYWQEELNRANNVPKSADKLELEIAKFFEQEVVLTADFFKDVIQYNPAYLIHSFELFQIYIKAITNDENVDFPKDVDYEYYGVYRDKLEEEFGNGEYDDLRTFFENPLSFQNGRIKNLLNHYSEIRQLFTKPLQEGVSPETLSDLYIEPNFKVSITNVIEPDKFSGFISFDENITTLDFVLDFFLKDNKHQVLKYSSNMLFVLGQPGQGKTSLCYKMVNDYLNREGGIPQKPVLFIKIRDLVTADFIKQPFETVINHLRVEFDFNNDELILILDGLDEAYMSGGVSDRELSNLYERLKKSTFSNKGLKIILTSRLNYLKLDDPCLDNSLIISLSEFSDSQVLDYVQKFKAFHAENSFVNKVPEILHKKTYKHISELLKQASLIYFIALLDIDINAKDSKMLLYDKIFDALAQRSWDKNGQLDYIHPNLKNNYDKYSKYLRRYIRVLAFKIYQSPNLFITTKQLQDLEETRRFVEECFQFDLNSSNSALEKASKYLLISFYFQESKNTESKEVAIEFFHNSLWEYLASEYIWEEAKKSLCAQDIDGDFYNVTDEMAFTLLNKLVGNKILGSQIQSNLVSILSSVGEENAQNFVNQFYQAFYKLHSNGFLIRYSKTENNLVAIEKLKNIALLGWILLHTLNYNVRKILQVDTDLYKLLFEDGYRDVFKNVKFSSINKMSHSSSKFENVTFENIHRFSLVECQIQNSSFIDCDPIFSFSFYHSVINRTRFVNCLFIDVSTIRDVDFRTVTFENVRVPTKNFWERLKKGSCLISEEIISNHKIKKSKEKSFWGTDYEIVEVMNNDLVE